MVGSPGQPQWDRSYVIFGKTSGFDDIDLTTLTPDQGFSLRGSGFEDNIGISVSSAGDFNGDGFDDLIVGAPTELWVDEDLGPFYDGRAWIIFGKASGFSDMSLSGGYNIPADVGLELYAGSVGNEGPFAGASVALAGDVNGDGYSDVIVGVPEQGVNWWNPGDGFGAAYVIYGQAPTGPVVRDGSGIGQTIRGGRAGDTLRGLGGDDVLLGGGGLDRLEGGSRNDLLDGGGNADTMLGGKGNDTYIVNHTGDIVDETGGDGIDTVEASISYTLTDGVENLRLTGTAALDGTGNGLANAITGNGAANTLAGLGGNDVLKGLDGNDTVSGGDGDDILRGNDGNDTLDGGNDNDTLFGGDGRDLLEGQDGDDTLYGQNGVDTLSGGIGADRLAGGGGADTLTGGADADSFVFDAAPATGADTVTDFVSGIDILQLDDAIFTALAPGALAGSAFAIGPAAGDADDRIIYDTSNGVLWYDADGIGGDAALHFATLAGTPSLGAADFLVA
nr:hypothetical protein [Methylobrevis pamukkalensis]